MKRKDAKVERAADMYVMWADEGKSLRQIADHYGISFQAVANALHTNGFDIRRRSKYETLDFDAIYARYQAGYTLTQIGKDYGVPPNYLADMLRKRGYVFDDKHHGYVWTPERLAALKADYDSGMNQTQLADKYGVQQSNISEVMRRYEIERRPYPVAVKLGKSRQKDAQS